jgi:major membrane immunogen (membrane-anchored lipoprotein)
MKILPLLGVLVALALLSGCGETVVDNTKTADTLKAELEKTTPEKITSVDCPSGVEVDPGKTFECTVKIKGGGEKKAKIEITDKEADLRLVNTTEFETAPSSGGEESGSGGEEEVEVEAG